MTKKYQNEEITSPPTVTEHVWSTFTWEQSPGYHYANFYLRPHYLKKHILRSTITGREIHHKIIVSSSYEELRDPTGNPEDNKEDFSIKKTSQ